MQMCTFPTEIMISASVFPLTNLCIRTFCDIDHYLEDFHTHKEAHKSTSMWPQKAAYLWPESPTCQVEALRRSTRQTSPQATHTQPAAAYDQGHRSRSNLMPSQESPTPLAVSLACVSVLAQCISIKREFCPLLPPAQGYNRLSQLGGAYSWHLLSRGQGNCKTSYSALKTPHGKEYLAQNTNSAKMQRPCTMSLYFSLLS